MFKYLNLVRIIHGSGIFNFNIRAFQKAWKRARAKAGNEWASPHDMRHFFCSYLINQGVDHLTVAQLSGHKTLKVLKERYAHFEGWTLKKAVSLFYKEDNQKAGFGKSLANFGRKITIKLPWNTVLELDLFGGRSRSASILVCYVDTSHLHNLHLSPK